MEQHSDLQFDEWLRQTGPGFAFPPTPDIGVDVLERVRRNDRRPLSLKPAWAFLVLLLAVALLMLVPQVRASVLEILRTGGITIFVTEPTPQAEDPSSISDTPTAVIDVGLQPSPILIPVKRTSLEAAREAFEQAIKLPSVPAELGAPDHIYIDVQTEPQVVVLDWLDGESEALLYRLYTIAATSFAFKQVDTVVSTNVHDAEAFWVDGPHGILLQDNGERYWEVTGGPVLIWSEGELTYRLEGAASLEEARQFAESLD